MKDARIEQLLNEGGWEWDYREGIPFKEIDLQRSVDNPGRMGRRLDPAKVDDYAAKMKDGVKFPALLLMSPVDPDMTSTHQYVVTGGVHRIHAAIKSGMKSYDAYRVRELDNYRRDLLFRLPNTLEGQGLSREEVLSHALAAHLGFPNLSLTKIARDFSCPIEPLRNKVKQNDTIMRAFTLGHDVLKNMSQSVCIKLATLGANDKVFSRALIFIKEFHPTGAQVIELVDRMKQGRSQEAQLRSVEVYQEEVRQEQISGGQFRSPQDQLARLRQNMSRVTNLIAKGLDQFNLATVKDFTEDRGRASDLQAAVSLFLEEINRLEGIREGIQEAAE